MILRIAAIDPMGRLQQAGIYEHLNHGRAEIDHLNPSELPLSVLLEQRYDAILLDPDISAEGLPAGFQFVSSLRSPASANRTTPIVVLGRYFLNGDAHYRGVAQKFHDLGQARYHRVNDISSEELWRAIHRTVQ